VKKTPAPAKAEAGTPLSAGEPGPPLAMAVWQKTCEGYFSADRPCPAASRPEGGVAIGSVRTPSVRVCSVRAHSLTSPRPSVLRRVKDCVVDCVSMAGQRLLR